MTKLEITKWLEKKLSYDGDADTKCPYCKRILQRGNRWYDHYESMADNLAVAMKLNPDTIGGIIKDIVCGDVATGNAKEDAKRLAEEIYRVIYGIAG